MKEETRDLVGFWSLTESAAVGLVLPSLMDLISAYHVPLAVSKQWMLLLASLSWATNTFSPPLMMK